MTDPSQPVSHSQPLSADSLWERTAIALGTGLYVGFVPVAPGTFGTLWGIPLAWWAAGLPFWGQALTTVLIILAGIPICGRAARGLGKEDPGAVVLDEIAAYLAIFLVVPFDWKTAVLAYAAFRLFDITKPWPVNQLERLPGGLGIMADDLGAAVYAAAGVAIMRWLVPGIG